MNKTHVKTHEKRQGRENKIFKDFAKQSNNHCMLHRTSSTSNGYEWKINYDWPYCYLPIYSVLEINRNRELPESKYIGL